MRLVMDTDVLVAGLTSRSGASRILLQAVDAGVIKPLVSAATILEYEAVLTRESQLVAMHATRDDVAGFLDRFRAMATEVSPGRSGRREIRDPNDDNFVSAAINGSAEAITSFNIMDYVPRKGRVTGLGILVCRPGEILRRLSWRPSATLPSACLLH